MNKEISLRKILPVMFGFFIMGFVDIVGVSTSYVKNDFAGMNDTMVNLISLSCFLWFFLLSIPTGMLMNRIGRKKTVLLSFALHVAAMIVPLAAYDFTAVLIAFALIGIGNTLLQVSLNPLVTNVIAGDKLTGTLTLGQFVKAVSSFLGPIIAATVTGSFLGWKMIFPIYAAISLLALVWLWLTPIAEQKVASADISIGHTFSLLKDKYIVAFFIGILVLVGVDVGMGITFPKLLMERCNLPLTDAGMGNSVYFFARTVGAFLGGILLMKLPERKFFTASVFVALAGLAGMIFLHGLWSRPGLRGRIRNWLRQPFLDHLLDLDAARSRAGKRGFGPADRRRGGRRRHSPGAGRHHRRLRVAGCRHHRTERRMALSGFPHRRNQCPFEESLTPGISPTTLNGCIQRMHPFLLHKNSRIFRYGSR